MPREAPVTSAVLPFKFITLSYLLLGPDSLSAAAGETEGERGNRTIFVIIGSLSPEKGASRSAVCCGGHIRTQRCARAALPDPSGNTGCRGRWHDNRHTLV